MNLVRKWKQFRGSDILCRAEEADNFNQFRCQLWLDHVGNHTALYKGTVYSWGPHGMSFSRATEFDRLMLR